MYIFIIACALISLSILWVFTYKFVPVHFTPLMLLRKIEHRNEKNIKTKKIWIKLKNIPEEIQKIFILAEDAFFYHHCGFDFYIIIRAIDRKILNGERISGVSSISQQCARSVFLLPARSVLRKLLEAYFTILIEIIWKKERILEVYLNVIEISKGIWGLEAAAKEFFNKSAKNLTPCEAGLIAACLPVPLERNPKMPDIQTKKLADEILKRKMPDKETAKSRTKLKKLRHYIQKYNLYMSKIFKK